jgi:glycosyltransferase involved in cell wall biosynthesis
MTAHEFAVNGRFLTQEITGVQRYARNILTAMDPLLAGKGQCAQIITPSGADDLRLATLPQIGTGGPGGHAWEQFVLPGKWSGRLLNLCNTAPVAKNDQIICIHDANIFAYGQSYGAAFRQYYSWLQSLVARRSLRIATVSAASARQIARYLPVRAEDIAIVPNGHEHALAWDPDLAKIAPSVLRGKQRQFVMAVGSQAQHKNMQLLIDIAPKLSELGIDVVIAGGSGSVFAKNEIDARPNVAAIGRVTDHDLAYLMERALCLVFPSWTEGFGLPIVEAMARGCPVISSDRASMPEVCGAAAMLASPADPDAWVRHIRAVHDSSGLRQDLVEKGRERARMFSWKNTADEYLDLLNSPHARIRGPRNKAEIWRGQRVAVIVATRGRPEIVGASVRYLLEKQSLKPVQTIVSCVMESDAGDLRNVEGVTVVTGPAGSSTQRNLGLSLLADDIDVVAFFDDDFVADKDWLAVAAATFLDERDVVGFTGDVLIDDIKGTGLKFDEAVRVVESDRSRNPRQWIEPFSPYGCNMAFRASAIGDVRFDERLVLYGWLEDRDFAATVAGGRGRCVKCTDARGVHMGVKGGRVAGEQFGYSQIVNPIYMLRKGTMTRTEAVNQIFRNVSSNIIKAARPEPYIDRLGRLRGNRIGMADIVRGRVEPERAARIAEIVGGRDAG